MSDQWFEALGEPVPDERRRIAAQKACEMGLAPGDDALVRQWIDRVAEAIERDCPETAIERARQKLDLTGAFRLLGYLCVEPEDHGSQLYVTELLCSHCERSVDFAHRGPSVPVDQDAPLPSVSHCPLCAAEYGDLESAVIQTREAEIDPYPEVDDD